MSDYKVSNALSYILLLHLTSAPRTLLRIPVGMHHEKTSENARMGLLDVNINEAHFHRLMQGM